MPSKRIYKIKRKQLVGIVISLIGIILLGFCLHAKQRLAHAETLSENVTNFFEHNPTWNPIIKFFGGEAQQKIASYNTPLLILTIVGIVLIVWGAVMIYMYRNHPKLGDKK